MKFSVAKSLPGSAPGGGPKVVSATSLSLARARHRIGVRGPGRVKLRGLGRGRGGGGGVSAGHVRAAGARLAFRVPTTWPFPPRRILTRCVERRHRILRSWPGLRDDSAPVMAKTEQREGAQRPQADASKRRQLCSRPTPAPTGQRPLLVRKERSGLLSQPRPSTLFPGHLPLRPQHGRSPGGSGLRPS